MVEYNPDRIRLARESEGFTQAQLSNELKTLSQSKLNKIENGLNVPTDDIVKEIAVHLDYPISFFKVSTGLVPYIKEYYYRRNLGVPKKHKMAFEAQMAIMAENIDNLFEAMEFNSKLPFFDLEDEEISPERVAKKMRSYFGIENGPINNIILTVQRMGVVIHYFSPPFTIKIDGVSFITKSGIPVILINENSSNSRRVFSVCHELGHLIMHYKYMVSDKRDVEDEANGFASEFLMPSESIKSSLHRLNAPKLYGLKKYWKVSIKALLYRAKVLNCITDSQYKRWMIQYNANKWTSNEPFEFDLEFPGILNRVFNLYFTTLEYSKEELLDLLHLTEGKISTFYNIPEINSRFKKSTPKLKLLVG